MLQRSTRLLAVLQLWTIVAVHAQSPCATIAPSGAIKPSIASGYEYSVLATGLTIPRTLRFDAAGNLLVMEATLGLSSYQVEEKGNCLQLINKKTVINDTELIHGLELSPDGQTIYAQTTDQIYSKHYDAHTRTTSSEKTTLITGISGTDHITRTLLLPRSVKDTLVISRGSMENVDPQAANKSSGLSTVKAFSLKNVPKGGYDHASSGKLLGWGLRNSVGITEHPLTGGIWTVENSVDDIERDGQDIHNNNPGEELNFLGYLNGRWSREEGTNFGYPNCFTTWDPSEMPANESLSVGTPFAPESANDTRCVETTTAPRLTFQAHTAPLDIKFNNSAEDAWITFHGSWDREIPVGYAIGKVKFSKAGEPVAPRHSTDSVETIFANQDNSVCPLECVRPTDLVFDHKGRMFVTSDLSGEIYVVKKIAS